LTKRQKTVNSNLEDNEKVNKAWPKDFPKIMHFIDVKNVTTQPLKLLEQHPDYDAAKKHQDMDAAARLVKDFLSAPENQQQLASLRDNYPNAVIVSVHAVEASGINKIPEALANYIGKCTGLKVDEGIVQTNQVFHTKSSEWHRFAFRPKFAGDVQKGHPYILIDDVSSHGSTFSELRYYIEKTGGNVAQTVALSLGGHGETLALHPGLRQTLVGKFEKDRLAEFARKHDLYEGNFEYLTSPEAVIIRKLPSLEKADRLIEKAKIAALTGEKEALQYNARDHQRDDFSW
jgi:hypothetical protein